MSGTLAISWGRYGGFYLHRQRVCLGWMALTYINVELDDLMKTYVATPDTPPEQRPDHQDDYPLSAPDTPPDSAATTTEGGT